MRIWEGFQHGINFGGWLSQGEHSDKHYETFLTETDFAVAARWGLDHVRIPVDYELVETEGGIQKESGFQWIAQCITWCRKYGLHMILDLHKTAGYTFDDPIHSDEFFTNPALQARFISLWQEFAKRYGKDHDVVAFELLNEIVNAESAESWNRIAANAVAAIRSVAQKNYILIGGIHHNGADGVSTAMSRSSLPIRQHPGQRECHGISTSSIRMIWQHTAVIPLHSTSSISRLFSTKAFRM